MKVLHLTTWRTPCGVADYAEHMVGHLEKLDIRGHVHALSIPDMKLMAPEEIQDVFREFLQLTPGFDLVHIQHEFSFFAGPDGINRSIANFSRLLRLLSTTRVPIVVTFHTDPDFKIRKQRIRGRVRALFYAHYWRWKVSPFFQAKHPSCRAVVHTRKSRLALLRTGFAAANVRIVPMGCPERDQAALSRPRHDAKEQLGLPTDCILLSIFGFVAAYKGHKWAVRALKILPPQYHLAIVGGLHPESVSDDTIDYVLRTWTREDQRRLTITGYASRETIDLYHAATDICLALHVPQSSFAASAGVTWALSSGKPTIATKIPSFLEINQKAECMVLVTPNAVHELSWQISKLAADRDLQARLVRNALHYAADNGWPEVTNRLVTVYRELVSDPARRAPSAGVHEGGPVQRGRERTPGCTSLRRRPS